MPNTTSLPANSLDQVRAVLSEQGIDYLLLSALPASCAHVQFIGRFEGQEVLWNMHLYTLARCAQESEAEKILITPDLRGLMRITPEATQVFQLAVALKVPVIDTPTIQKAILMLRNYRKLARGVHTWG